MHFEKKMRISPSLGSSRSSGWLSLTSEHTEPSPIPESVRETCLRWWRSGEFLPASIWAFLTASRQMFSMTGMQELLIAWFVQFSNSPDICEKVESYLKKLQSNSPNIYLWKSQKLFQKITIEQPRHLRESQKLSEILQSNSVSPDICGKVRNYLFKKITIEQPDICGLV